MPRTRVICGLEQQRAHGGSEGQRADRGQGHRHGEGEGELLVELPRKPAEKSNWHEYRRQHQGDRDHRAADVGNGRLGGLHRCHAPGIQALLHRLHHDDRIVDHDPDGKHQPEQGQGVDGKAQRRERSKGTDERNRYHQDRDQRRTPALQEQEDDEHDQHEGYEQRLDHLFQGFGDERRRAVRNGVHHAWRKMGRLVFHHLLALLGDVERIGIRLQEDPDQRSRDVVVGTADRIVGSSELDAGHVFEAHHLPVAGLPDDDVLEFADLDQAALDEYGVLHLLPLRDRGQADAAGGRNLVLLADDVGDVGGGDAQSCHALRVEPDAHAVVAGAENAYLPHAPHPAERVIQVEQRIIAQKDAVVAALGGGKRDDLEKVGAGLAHGYAVADHVRGKLALRDGNPVLNFDRIDVLVGADIEGHRQGVGAVVAALRVHIEHVLGAIDLLLDGGGHGLRHHVRVGAREGCGHRDLGWNHLRILGNRKTENGKPPDQDHDQRDNGGEDRSLDEEVEHSGPSLIYPTR